MTKYKFGSAQRAYYEAVNDTKSTVRSWHPKCTDIHGNAACKHFVPIDITDEVPEWGLGHCERFSDSANGGPYFSPPLPFGCLSHTDLTEDET